jgi:hypothetical protein
MDESMLQALEAQRLEIRQRWEALLRVEPVNTPLGQPEVLKHMVDFTLNTLFASIRAKHVRKRNLRSVSASVADRSLCPCGRNPLLAYFVAGEQAVLETLILAQAKEAESAEVRSADAHELKQTMANVALREIETFCAVCQHRGIPVEQAAVQQGLKGT